MSDARSSRNVVSSLHPTRQQLDELDALLQRMLDLPVNRVDEKVEAPPTPGADGRAETRQAGGASGGGRTAIAPSARSVPLPRLARPTPPAPPPPGGRTAESKAARGEAPPSTPSQPAPPKTEAPPSEEDNSNLILEAPVEEASEQPSSALPIQPPHRLRRRTPPPQTTAEPEEGSEGPDGDWVPFRSAWKPSPHTWPPLAESWAQAQTPPDGARLRRDEPAIEPGADTGTEPAQQSRVSPLGLPEKPAGPPLRRAPEPGPLAHLRTEPAIETVIYPRPLFGSTPELSSPQAVSGTSVLAEAGAGAVSWLLRPIVWMNGAFDTVASSAGAPGAWLAGPVGKSVLGVVGLFCLAGAAVLVVADWLGWTW